MQAGLNTIGCNIHYWGKQQQNRLLSECIAPVINGLHERRVLRRFWYDRINTRGPHIFLLTGVESNVLPEARRHLTESINAYLQARPSEDKLTLDELQFLHADMGGKTFCEADKLRGLAGNNTFDLFEQTETQYPFNHINGALYEYDLWPCINALYLWSLKCLGARHSGGLERIAAVFALMLNQVCFAEREAAADYWKHHAGTLLKGVDHMQLTGASLAGVLTRLTGAGNLALLNHYRQILASSALSELAAHADPTLSAAAEAVGPLKDLREYIVAAQRSGPGHLPKDAKAVVREILHTMFKQFGLRVPQHIPITLFLWSASLDHEHGYSVSLAG